MIRWARGDKPLPLRVNMDLTGSDIVVKVRSLSAPDADAATLSSAIVSATTGDLTADPSGLAPGSFKIEVEVTRDGELVATFPNDGLAVLLIRPDL